MIEVKIDLVCTVDGEIVSGIFVEAREGNTEGVGLLLRALGGGHADDVGKFVGGPCRS